MANDIDLVDLQRQQLILRQQALRNRQAEQVEPVTSVRSDQVEPVIDQAPSLYTADQFALHRSIDRDRGAPAVVRTYVGNLDNPADRLATLRNYYPDAQPYGNDNFVFTDPTTGRPTLYNPAGLDWADVASVGRDITQGVFATGGAIVGGAGGVAAGLPTGPGALLTGGAGAAAGAGAGNAIGGQVYDGFIALFAGDQLVDSRTAGNRLARAGLDFVLGAAGQRLGELGELGVRRLLAGGTRQTQQLLQRFYAFQTRPTAGQLTGNRALQTIESALEASPGGGGVMQQAAADAVEGISQAVRRITSSFDDAGRQVAASASDEALGARMRMAATGTISRQQATHAQTYDDVFAELAEGGTQRVLSMDALVEFRHGLITRLQAAPQSLESTLRPVIRQIDTMMRDFRGGYLTFEGLRDFRSQLGARIGNQMTSGSNAAQHALERRLYGVLTDDMKFTAGSIRPSALSRLERADAAFASWKQEALKTFERMVNTNADESVWRFIQTASRDNAEALRIMQRHFTTGEWEDLVAATIYRLGQATPARQGAEGGQFSVALFLSRWNGGGGRGGLSEPVKDILFNGTRHAGLRQELDNLSVVIDAMQHAEAVANRSNTARTLIAFNLISVLGGGAATAVTGNPMAGAGAAAGGIASFIIAPRMAARLLTNRRFVEWLASPITRSNGVGAHLGRLVAIASDSNDPQFQSDVRQYLEVVRQSNAGE